MKNKILELLKKHPNGLTPTEIGLKLGKVYTQASSSTNQPLKMLIKDGKVVRKKIDGKVKYYAVKSV